MTRREREGEQPASARAFVPSALARFRARDCQEDVFTSVHVAPPHLFSPLDRGSFNIGS